jgi:hypothetical protein
MKEDCHPIGLFWPYDILERKWEVVSLYFIEGLPMALQRHDCIMVVVDLLTKNAHSIPIKSTYDAITIVEVFIK